MQELFAIGCEARQPQILRNIQTPLCENMELHLDYDVIGRDHQLQVWAGNGRFGPKGGILDGISIIAGRLFVNALATNKVFAVPIDADGKAGAIVELKLSRPIDAPDGCAASEETACCAWKAAERVDSHD